MVSSVTSPTLDSGTWIHGTFVVTVGSDFTTFVDILKYAQQDERYGTNAAPALEPNVSTILNSSPGGSDSPLPVYLSKRKCRDTSLGGNDAINPLPQFGYDDDISHPHYNANYGSSIGMGQVYSENYDDTQQILYLGFGIPVFTDLAGFWGTAVDMDMAGLVNKGTGITAEKIGYLIGSAPIRIFNLASIPFKFIGAMIDSLQTVPITKYYSFSSNMPMYFKFVNTILVMLATNMNIVGSSDTLDTTGSTVGTEAALKLSTDNNPTDTSGLPDPFKTYGFDMAQIMTKRYVMENGTNTSIGKRNTDDGLLSALALNGGDGTTSLTTTTDTSTSTNATPNATNSGTSTTADPKMFWQMSWFDSLKAAYGDAIYDGHLYIGFRIDRAQAPSETFTNQSGESQIAQIANEKFQEGQNAQYSSMGNEEASTVLGGVLAGAVEAAQGVLKGITGSMSLDPLAAVMSGTAKIDIPEVWTESGFSRSASFTITSRSPYGDFESIYMNNYVPVACLLAGALPRGTGYSSHSSPFIIQAYCRGIFSSPLCMIETLEIQRGEDQYGFTAARLPLKVQMSVTLKDLSPIMYLNMGGNGSLLGKIWGTDDLFQEYMMTLSGMGLRDRLTPWKNMRRKTQILVQTLYKNKLSPYMLGMEGGSRFTISRVISMIKSADNIIPST